MNKIICPILAALALTSCMSGTTGMKLSESHPANPAAAQASDPPLAPFLLADTNLVVMTTSSTDAPEGGHEGMGGMKGMSGAKQSQGMDMPMDSDTMNVMGAMPGGAMAQSALPGVPGVSHLYHIGAAGFFLDHQEHIQLSTEQKKQLNQIREDALLDKATADRNLEEAEQQLWKLTAADQPDLAPIEAKVREIEKLRGDQRLTLVRPVVEAAKVLTEEQTKILLGTVAPVMPDMPAAKPATPGSKPAEEPAAKPGHKH